MLISAARVVTPARVFAPGWVHVEGECIAEVQPGRPPRPADVDLPDATVVPGFVDAHVHGGGGAAFDAGGPEAAADVAAAHLRHGTTTLMASLVTDAPEPLSRRVGELADLVDDGLLAGIHLEGPWLSPEHVGAHNPALLAHPTPEAVDRLLDAGRGRVRMVTLAPELPGGLDAVRRLTAAGVVAAIGHTDATYDDARAALDAGATVGTHLFNAMRGLHHREPGPVTALLEHPDAFVELVADGVHLHPAVVRLVADRKPHLTVLVTDAMAAAGTDDGAYVLGTMAVRVRDGIARLEDTGAIAGSTLTMAGAVRFAVQQAGLPIEDVVRAATASPAAAPRCVRGRASRPGFGADLVVLDADLEVARVLQRGRWVV